MDADAETAAHEYLARARADIDRLQALAEQHPELVGAGDLAEVVAGVEKLQTMIDGALVKGGEDDG